MFNAVVNTFDVGIMLCAQVFQSPATFFLVIDASFMAAAKAQFGDHARMLLLSW